MQKIAKIVLFSIVILGLASTVAKAETPLVLAKNYAPTIVENMRYATSDNFLHAAVYADNRCWLTPEAAKKLAAAAKSLDTKHRGWRLKVWDCYRPHEVQVKMWHIMPNPKFVADPKRGSRHSLGTAVDLTIVDEHGKEVRMPTEFDNFTKKARADAPTTSTAAANRALLQQIMMEVGFVSIRTEWWHFQ